ncbi:hypothetical protein AVEN_19007-1 [Araneus ventricosus]|uniref:CCHC-type domain-containing protein n=1 Tax=Araneus ventricosus TaxID=182803 RepID=A0A4Y2KKG7_ARAVE|nr:hypothetical protein AVEN_19007-1 [Araneus ventricosus]
MDIIVYILMSLLPEYDSTKSAIQNQPSEQVSLQFVVSRLLDTEELLKDRQVSETKAPRSESSNDVAFPTNQLTVACFKCNKKGHTARFCDKTVVCHHIGKLGHKKRNFRNLTHKKPPFKEEAAAVSFVVGGGEVKKFIVDSGATSHMCLYVDDLLISGSDPDEMKTVINLLQNEFEMSKSTPATEFLGIRLVFTPTEMELDQEEYIDKMLKLFNKSDFKPCSTPLEQTVNYCKQ